MRQAICRNLEELQVSARQVLPGSVREPAPHYEAPVGQHWATGPLSGLSLSCCPRWTLDTHLLVKVPCVSARSTCDCPVSSLEHRNLGPLQIRLGKSFKGKKPQGHPVLEEELSACGGVHSQLHRDLRALGKSLEYWAPCPAEWGLSWTLLGPPLLLAARPAHSYPNPGTFQALSPRVWMGGTADG